MAFRTPDDICAYAMQAIKSLHYKPNVYSGDGTQPGQAESLDSLFRQAYQFWSWIQRREYELLDAIESEHGDRNYKLIGFPRSYRKLHPDCSPREVFDHVLDCWAGIGDHLGVDVTQTFPAKVRLKKSEDFQKVFANKRSVADHNLVVYASPNGTLETRIGLAVGKKVGNAVTRNHWKRMLREAFRVSREELPAGYDLVLLPRRGVKPELEGLRKSLVKLVNRLDRKRVQ